MAPFILEASTVERLTFGLKARRRARRRQLKRRAALVSLAAMLLGLPGATFGFDLVDRMIGQRRAGVLRGTETSESTEGILRFKSEMFARRPVTEPSASAATPPEAVAVASSPTVDLIYAAAAEFGLSGDYLLSVAECESSLDPSAYSPAGYYGLFQFDQSTWAAYGYGSIYDPVAQARTAARLIAAGQSERWPNCA